MISRGEVKLFTCGIYSAMKYSLVRLIPQDSIEWKRGLNRWRSPGKRIYGDNAGLKIYNLSEGRSLVEREIGDLNE